MNNWIPPDHLDRIYRQLDSLEDRAIFKIAYNTGFRIDDILSIRRYQLIDRAVVRSVLTIKERKTGHTRSVKLEPGTASILSQLERERSTLAGRGALSYYFRSRVSKSTQKRMKQHRSTFYRHFSKAVKKAGLKGLGYTVHSLRKVYARSLYDRTNSLLSVQRDLGHQSLATTMLYVNDLRI